MSETNPSLVASELAKISTFETETEKRKSTLTLNELNYISDKQLHRKTDGEGGSGDSPIKLADVRFTSEETRYSSWLNVVLHTMDMDGVAVYVPETTSEGWFGPAHCGGMSLENVTIADWNETMDFTIRCLTPMALGFNDPDSYQVVVVSGDAELRTVEQDGQEFQYLYITGDCVINIETNVADS